MKKLTKAGLKREIETIKQENLYKISKLAMSNWNTYKWIQEISSYQVKYYKDMKTEEIFYMKLELKKCLNIETTIEENLYKTQYENEKVKVA